MVGPMAVDKSGKSAKLILPDGKEQSLPVVVGTENEQAIDIRALRNETGFVTLRSAPSPAGLRGRARR